MDGTDAVSMISADEIATIMHGLWDNRFCGYATGPITRNVFAVTAPATGQSFRVTVEEI